MSASRLVLLGTGGGPTPKVTRSAPAFAVAVDGATYIVDCGNGVARQMAKAALPFRSLRAVFITHHHSDHNADYGNLFLLLWAAGLNAPVDAFGPPPLARMTEQYLALNAYDIATRIADEGRPPLAPLVRAHDISAAGEAYRDARVRVSCALVEHPPVVPAFAFRFDMADRSIVFSGDTAPCDSLVELATGADVLVHEVMYEPALDEICARLDNAKRLRRHLLDSHTTADQVGVIAREAGVKCLVLSHFVPAEGVADELWLEAAARNFSGRIVLGRDLMEI
ncbi:MAG: MBL fold metallo-hydrolase [Betaproteobacteria bacterium]|nr:MAG: MBL fold metallo-hydrolase [Betaproteobacteria bacterium]